MRGNGVFTENIENIFEIEGRNVTDRESLPDLPGYVTAKQAAKMLGLSDRRIYQLIEAGRLPVVKAGEHILLSVEAIEQFNPRLTGRPREKTPAWRFARRGGTLRTLSIQVQIRADQQDRLQLKLWRIKQEAMHTFPGTTTRLIMKDDTTPPTITIILVWDPAALPEDLFQIALRDMEEDLADVLDWQTAIRKTGRLMIGT